MAECKECSRSGWLLRINGRGVCHVCDEELRARADAEVERVKQALIFSRVLKSPTDRLIHLRRALAGVRTLVRYKSRGCAEIRPEPGKLLRLLERQVEEAQGQDGVEAPRLDGAEGETNPTLSSGPEHDEGGERRRWRRSDAAFVGHLRVAGVRARAEDVSAGGVRVCSPFVRRIGSRVELSFQTPSGRVSARALVRWASPLARGRGGKGAMGLELLERPEALTRSLPNQGRAV